MPDRLRHEAVDLSAVVTPQPRRNILDGSPYWRHGPFRRLHCPETGQRATACSLLLRHHCVAW
jgi:hypothetical protein